MKAQHPTNIPRQAWGLADKKLKPKQQRISAPVSASPGSVRSICFNLAAKDLIIIWIPRQMAVYRHVQLLTGTGRVGERVTESFLLSPWLLDKNGADSEQREKARQTAAFNLSELETPQFRRMWKHSLCKCLVTFSKHYRLCGVRHVGNHRRATERK